MLTTYDIIGRRVIVGLFKQDRKADTASVGLVGHTAVLNALIRAGLEVLVPWGDHYRYDLAIIDPESPPGSAVLLRVQCKTARLSRDRGYLLFSTFSVTIRVGGKAHAKKGYQGQLEYFAVYSPDIEKVYLVPVGDITYAGEARLRLKPPRNGQEQGVRWAKDYEL